MEKHRCRLCFRNFSNGRALGGHMRSHMMNFYAAKKGSSNHEKGDSPCENLDDFLSYSSTSSQSSWERGEEEEEKGMSSYELRGNPRKSTLFVDPEISSVVLQDGESETESLKNSSVCRRSSKRVRNSRIPDFNGCGMKGFFQVKKSKFGKEVKSSTNTSNSTANYYNQYSSLVETEPLSSISDTTPEEDVAYCLIMLSRDQWKREVKESQEEEEEEEAKEFEDDYYYEDSGVIKVKKTKGRGKYRCDTCNKLFRSYQALGGHRASHKKIKVNPRYNPSTSEMGSNENAGGGSSPATVAMVVEEKTYECPFCHRVFSSGQALGGHKRSHFMGNGAISSNVRSISPVKPIPRISDTLNIDLNLPAPVDNNDDDDGDHNHENKDEDEEISQISLSAISDAEFVHPIKQ